jgi:hypothetical protein
LMLCICGTICMAAQVAFWGVGVGCVASKLVDSFIAVGFSSHHFTHF